MTRWRVVELAPHDPLGWGSDRPDLSTRLPTNLSCVDTLVLTPAQFRMPHAFTLLEQELSNSELWLVKFQGLPTPILAKTTAAEHFWQGLDVDTILYDPHHSET